MRRSARNDWTASARRSSADVSLREVFQSSPSRPIERVENDDELPIAHHEAIIERGQFSIDELWIGLRPPHGLGEPLGKGGVRLRLIVRRRADENGAPERVGVLPLLKCVPKSRGSRGDTVRTIGRVKPDEDVDRREFTKTLGSLSSSRRVGKCMCPEALSHPTVADDQRPVGVERRTVP